MSQINVFMLGDDIREFAQFASDECGMILLEGDQFDSPAPNMLVGMEDAEASRAVTLIDSALFDRYRPREMHGGIWMYDQFKTPAIEFCVPRLLEDGRLLSGRIFAKIGWLDSADDNRVYKASYAKLDRRLKRTYHKVEGHWWVSDRVRAWSLDGGVLAFGSQLGLSRSLISTDVEA